MSLDISSLHPDFDKVFAFLEQVDLTLLRVGKEDIDIQ